MSCPGSYVPAGLKHFTPTQYSATKRVFVHDANSAEVLTRVEGHVAVVTLNRPDSYNSLSGTLMVRLAEQLRDLAADPEIGCVVITGAGKAFSSGGDVRAQVERAKD